MLWSIAVPITQGAAPRTRVIATPVRFSELVRFLDDPRPAIRLEAISYLATLNRPVGDTVPVLRRRFADPDPLVRVQAVRVAIRSGMPAEEGVPVAAQLLDPDRPDVCCLAADILADAGPAATDALPGLNACLDSSSIWVRLHACRAACQIGARDAAILRVLLLASGDEERPASEFAATILRDVIAELSRQLNDVDPKARCRAVIRLEQLGSAAASAMQAIIARLDDPDLLVRAHAARAALRTGVRGREIVDVTSALLVPDRFDVLRVAALTLVELGPDAREALPKLHDCLNAASIAVRLYAAEAALRINPNDQMALEELQLALDHRQFDVRYFSVNALGAAVSESDQAVFVLQHALSDSDPKIAAAAALQLSRTHDLIRHASPDGPAGESDDDQTVDLDEPGPFPLDFGQWITELSHPTVDVRRTAAIRLAIVGPAAQKAVPALIECLGDPDPVVRLHVAQAIWEIDRNVYPILPVFIDLMLSNRAGTRIGAVYALGRMGALASAADTVPWLERLLADRSSFDRPLLAQVIVRIQPTHQAALAVLTRGVKSADADVRYLSTVALGAMPLSRQVAVHEALRGAVDDGNARVRCAACETLSQLQVRNAVVLAATPAQAGPELTAEAKGAPNP
jgi:HEAT repeat protein